jgi:hypothetical protein
MLFKTVFDSNIETVLQSNKINHPWYDKLFYGLRGFKNISTREGYRFIQTISICEKKS